MIRGGTESAARPRLDVAEAAETEFDPESATNPIQPNTSAALMMVRRMLVKQLYAVSGDGKRITIPAGCLSLKLG
jgi:hypothetical protein